MGQVTVAQVVEMTIQDLEGINVPVSLIEQIGTPIRQAVHNLREVQAAWARESAKAQEKAEEEAEAAEEGAEQDAD